MTETTVFTMIAIALRRNAVVPAADAGHPTAALSFESKVMSDERGCGVR